jgi:hypothetical protein
MGANCEVQSADVLARPETVTAPTVGSDATWFVRDAAKCPNRRRSGSAPGTLPLRRIGRVPICKTTATSAGRWGKLPAEVGYVLLAVLFGMLLGALFTYIAVAARARTKGSGSGIEKACYPQTPNASV